MWKFRKGNENPISGSYIIVPHLIWDVPDRGGMESTVVGRGRTVSEDGTPVVYQVGRTGRHRRRFEESEV